MFHQCLTYTVAGLTVLETLTALNILHHFTFVVRQGDNDFAALKTAETDERNQRIMRMRGQQCHNDRKENKVSRSMWRVNFFRQQRWWHSSDNTSMFCWSNRRTRRSDTFLTVINITVSTTLKPVSVLHTKDAYETHRSHDKGLAFDRHCNMSFKAETTQQNSNSETVDVGVVQKRS